MNTPLLGTYAVLVGLTPVVPVPFLDDFLADRLRRSLVSKIAEAHRVTLDDKSVARLGDEPSPSLSGAATSVAKKALFYPVKRVFRKVFLTLAVNDAIDAMGKTYAYGYLVDVALARGWVPKHDAVKVRRAIDSACKTVGTSALRKVIAVSVEQGKVLGPALVRRVREAFGAGEGAAENAASGVGAKVDAAAHEVGPAYFDALTAALAQELGEAV